MVYDDDKSSFQDLLARDGAYTIHDRNIQALALECYKASQNIGPSLLNDIFKVSDYHGPILRNKGPFVKSRIGSVHFGENSLKFLGPKIWELIPNVIKDVDTLDKFKVLIKKWVPKPCPCRLCKTYVHNLGFVNIN